MLLVFFQRRVLTQALDYGYAIFFCEPSTPWARDAKLLAERNSTSESTGCRSPRVPGLILGATYSRCWCGCGHAGRCPQSSCPLASLQIACSYQRPGRSQPQPRQAVGEPEIIANLRRKHHHEWEEHEEQGPCPAAPISHSCLSHQVGAFEPDSTMS